MNGLLLPRSEVGPVLRERMFRLLGRWFDGITRERFEADLADKDWVILLEDDAGALAGFSTLALYPARFRGEALTVVCSGDTLVDPAAWGRSILPSFWIDSVLALHREHGRGRLLWLLLTSGFRTYRFLPVFWRRFHPRWDEPLPAAVRALRDALAGERFGGLYDPAAGVVRFPEPQRLRPELAAVPPGRARDPHVDFFRRVNPGYLDGDELVCLTELSPDNLTPAGRRMVEAGARRRPVASGR